MTDNQQGKREQRQSTGSVVLDQAQIARLDDALDRLRPRDRSIFLAACRQEAPYAAIAARHSCTIAMVLFVGNGGEIEAKVIRTKRVAREGTGDAPAMKPDYSGALIETLSRIKTLAVQEAVATNPALALDILLDCLVGQGVHGEPSYYSPLSLRLECFNASVPDDMMKEGAIASVDEIGAGDFAAVPEVNRFAAIRAMNAEAKGRLLALLVARQINGGETSGSRRDRRHQRFDQIVFASGVDMVSKWQAPVAFYDRLKKPVIAKIMTEVLGKAAADNCAKMKKGELAAAAAERMLGRGWLPPALVIAEPEPEPEKESVPFADCGGEDEEESEQAEAA